MAKDTVTRNQAKQVHPSLAKCRRYGKLRGALGIACALGYAATLPAQTVAPSGEPTIFTGNGYEIYCDENSSYFRSGMCLGFTMGVLSGFNASDSPRLYCLPGEATNKQIIDVVRSYIRNNPNIRHENSTLLIIAASAKAFPCPK